MPWLSEELKLEGQYSKVSGKVIVVYYKIISFKQPQKFYCIK